VRHPDLIGAAAIFLFGLVAIAAALTTPDPGFGVVGPGVFAGWLGVLVLATAVWIGWAALRTPPPRLEALDRRPLLLSVVAIAVYLALFVRVGFVVTSAIFLPIESRILGSRRPVRDIVAGAVFIVLLDLLFVRLLGVQLPKGLLSF